MMRITGKILVTFVVILILSGIADVVVELTDASRYSAVSIGGLAGVFYGNIFDRIWK